MLKIFSVENLSRTGRNFLAQFQTPSDTGLPSASITDIISNLMRWILAIVGIIGVIGFAVAGILYLTAAGDEDRVASAKRAFIYSILGVVIALSGVIIVRAIQNFLSASSNF